MPKTLFPSSFFTSESYDFWSTQMKTIFISQDLWDLIEEGYEQLEDLSTLTIAKLKEYKQRDARALLFIQQRTDYNARISPKDGTLLGWVLLQNLRENLLQAGNNGIDVLNGIAWNSATKRIFVTGKHWPKLYEIKLHQVNKTVKSGIIEQLCLRELAVFTKP
ncbi:glutaminyl-peptide cyclotransferase-like [Quercus lobata]|uniref:glutaminyl-peptide cyclotransferase-like n=1 Tax=Quercus lobata TaxID=97700 RepID=UPI001243FDA5|nr:glutaminyl-peptide cyclotransferase-like [Quercus lobata]